jgi:predicted O-methyltransferase YrrM
MTTDTEEGKLRSSYKGAANFGDVLGGIVTAKRPLRRIAEYGILDGFSLDIFAKLSPDDCVIEARDIFDNFEGNRADRAALEVRFADCSNIHILDGDFYEADKDLETGTYDLIHVDIANNGAVYAEAEQVLVPKLAPGGLLVLEGGTPERDMVSWMATYSKPPMVPEVERLRASGKYDVTVLGTFPGLTVVSCKPPKKLPGP